VPQAEITEVGYRDLSEFSVVYKFDRGGGSIWIQNVVHQSKQHGAVRQVYSVKAAIQQRHKKNLPLPDFRILKKLIVDIARLNNGRIAQNARIPLQPELKSANVGKVFND